MAIGSERLSTEVEASMYGHTTQAAAAGNGAHDAPHGSNLSAMHAWDDLERAALVALLRARPGGLTWPEIAAEVADARSARAVWEGRQSADLFVADQSLATVTTDIVAEIESWRAADFSS
ncbi:MAG TPA: hypothetical protein VH333_09580 [Pseudonocardiaceae bacterium]|jgi:DNA processing protein|nr:hypothetical protein [Pseudonocardiaceae bacterium]